MTFSAERADRTENEPKLRDAYELLSSKNPRFFAPPIKLDRPLTADEKAPLLRAVRLQTALMREQLEQELIDDRQRNPHEQSPAWTWKTVVRERLAALNLVGFDEFDIPDLETCAALLKTST